ncbi:MAG: hypothetical protein IT534_14150 [Bauldia sp.]|nr:hypothetical protein [Bauldia sp.]
MTAASRLTIHIGLHKTGTTAIQHYFWRHGEELLQHGIYYPATGRPTSAATEFGHHDVPWSFTPEAAEPPATLLARLRAEIETTTMPEIVLSSEEFSRMTPGQITVLARALPFRTRIVFYYRRQSEIVQGLYGTDVVHVGERRDIHAYAAAFKGPLDFGRLATDWAAVYGKDAITALAYQPSSFPDRNIVPHFLSAMGFTGPSGVGEAFHYNVSMPWYVVLSVLRLRSIHVSEATIAQIVRSFEIMLENEKPPKPGLFSPAEANEFDRRFAASNAAFAEAFAPGQPPVTPYPADGEDDFLADRKGLWPEVELTLRTVSAYIRTIHQTGMPPGATPS